MYWCPNHAITTALSTHRQYFSQENALASGWNYLIISSLEKSHAAVSSHPTLLSMKASHTGVQYETNTRQLNSSLHRQAADPSTGSGLCSYTQFLLSGRSPNPVTGSSVFSYTQFLLSGRSPNPVTGSSACSYTQFLLSGRSPNPVTGSSAFSYTQFLLSGRSPKRPCCSSCEAGWSM